MREDTDYPYALNVFVRLTQSTIKTIPVPHYFVHEGYDYWQFFKQRIFEDLKAFSATRKMPVEKKKTLNVFLKDTVVLAFLCILGIGACISAVMRRKKVVVYSIDRVNSEFKSDFRLDVLYRFLTQARISYTELFHTVVGGVAVKNARSRHRAALYLEVCHWLFWLGRGMRLVDNTHTIEVEHIDLSLFTETERPFVRTLLLHYIHEMNVSAFKVRLLSRIFRMCGYKVLFAIDDARYYYEILLAAQRAGVKTYALQHGHFTKYHVGWLVDDTQTGTSVYPDTLMVWSKYWKDELLRLGSVTPDSAVLVGGEKKTMVQHSGKRRNDDDHITILIPYETSCPKSEVAEYIIKMLATKKIEVIFKLRPDIPKEKQLAEYGLDTLLNDRFTTVTDIDTCIDHVDIVAGVYSTFLYEMIAYEKRVVLFKTSSDYGEGLLIHKLADELTIKDEMVTTLQKVKALPDILIQERSKKLYGESILLTDTLKEIAKEKSLI